MRGLIVAVVIGSVAAYIVATVLLALTFWPAALLTAVWSLLLVGLAIVARA